MLNKAVILITLVLSALLFACSGEKTPHERLAGIWDVNDKASWEYQRPGESYAPNIAELQRDISVQFNIKEQTCLALNAFGRHLLRYRVAAEEKDKATLVIGENTFTFEFKADDRLLLCPPDGGVADCLILTRGNSSAEADRQAKAKSRLAAIVKRHTQSVAARTEQFLFRALLDPGVSIVEADMFRLHVAEIDALENEQIKNAGQPPEHTTKLMNAMLRDVVSRNNLRYVRIYTSKSTLCLSSDMSSPHLSAIQHELLLNTVTTGKPRPIALINNGDEFLFELYLPIFKPFLKDEKNVVGVLAIARPMYPLPDTCFVQDISIPGGKLYFIGYTDENYQIIGTEGVTKETQPLPVNDSDEMPFGRRNSLVGDALVCSQASHGPVTNSWILLETNCPSAP